MEYRVIHTTTYDYTSPVSVCHNAVILTPTDQDDQRVLEHSINIDPVPAVRHQREDMFGNLIQRFSLEELHSKLIIKAVSRIRLSDPDVNADQPSQIWTDVVDGLQNRVDPNWLAVAPFQFDSPRIRRSATFGEYGQRVIRKNQPALDALLALADQIYRDFDYDKDATQVDTPTTAAFENRHGVCQDFAHVALACLRSIGIPARYVSGYLRTTPPPGKERLVGADQSHAWVSAYCGPNVGWIEVDPTNNCLCGVDHIRVAVGRDYSDVVPIKGVFLGGGEPALAVSVDVAPV